MKKLMIVAAVISIAALTGCRKDYTCRCTDPDQTHTWENQSKSNAETACEEADENWAAYGGNCELVED